MTIVTNEYATASLLTEAFATEILTLLKSAIAVKGQASLALSGGSTPKPLFNMLAKHEFDWENVSITLVDDRWVDANHEASNEKLVSENLLVGHAAKAKFVSLKSHHESPFDAQQEISARLDEIGDIDVLILGMGEDGHTASLFPCSAQLKEGLDLNRSLSAIATEPTTAPFQRISMSLATILRAKNILLHLTGDKKRAVLEDAINNFTELEKPIKAVSDRANLNLMWAP